MPKWPGVPEAVSRLLERPVWWLVVAALAVALALPSLRAGRQLDDYAHHVILTASPALADVIPGPLDMFKFLDGDPARTRRLMDRGLAPWWTLEEVRMAFWRPVAAWTHWLDYQLWPDRPALMHAHSLAWYAVLVAAVAALYRRLIGPVWVAGVATLLYAIDDAHGLPVGWLSNRNAVLASIFAALALWAHDRWQRSGWTLGALLGPLCFALALLSAEASVAVLGYVIAHALLLAHDRVTHRVRALIPYALVLGVWAVVYRLLSYGTRGIESYVDPFAEPWAFMRGVVSRGPIMLLAQWGLPPAELYAALSRDARRLMWLGAVLFLGLVTLLLWPLLKRSRLARFWALGQLLAVVPVCSPVPPDSRHLFIVGIGAMGLVALFLCGLVERAAWLPRGRAWRLPAIALAIVFIAVHLVISPISFYRGSRGHAAVEAWIQHLAATLPADPAIAGQELVILNAPDASVPVYADLYQRVSGHQVPRRTLRLAPADNVITISRPDARTVHVRPAAGYYPHAIDLPFRSSRFKMQRGHLVKLTGLEVEVREVTATGQPLEVAFRFAVPLEDPSLRWLRWHSESGRYVAFSLPAVGGSTQVR